MAIDGEPKNGDFVRYIERLNRQTEGAPGEVWTRTRRGISLNKRESVNTQSDQIETNYSPRSTEPSASSIARPSSPGSTDDSQESTTLAARGGQRHLSLALTIAAVIALWNALDRLTTAINTDSVDMDSLVPVFFLLVCAWMLFIGARGARRKQNKPLAKLPPLSTVQMGRKPKN